MDERYFTIDTKDLNFIGSAPSKFTLTIELSDKEFIESYFSGYESIILVRNEEEYTFTPEEFMEGMNRMAHTAKKVKVPRKDHLRIGHMECGECGAPIGYNNRYCHLCGARLLEDE